MTVGTLTYFCIFGIGVNSCNGDFSTKQIIIIIGNTNDYQLPYYISMIKYFIFKIDSFVLTSYVFLCYA